MTNQIHNAEAASAITEEVKLIPRWSIAVASLAFVFMQYLYWVILPAYRQSLHMRPVGAPLGVRFYFALSWSKLAALYVLADGGVTTVSDLADTLGRSPSATSRLVDGLVRRRLVERRVLLGLVDCTAAQLVDQIPSPRREGPGRGTVRRADFDKSPPPCGRRLGWGS